MKKFLIRFLLVGILGLPAVAGASSWKLDASHSSVLFSVKHMMVTNVRGSLQVTAGSLTLNDKTGLPTKVEGTVDAKSINTLHTKRDKHLRAEDFLFTEKFSTLTFVSKKVKKSGKQIKVTGDLTLRGKTKSVTFVGDLTPAITGAWGKPRRGLSATTTINRQDFGVAWSKTFDGGLVVGNDVQITLELEWVQGS